MQITDCQPDSGNPTVRDERGLTETWTRGELGTRGTTERVPVGNSPPTVARAVFLPDDQRAHFNRNLRFRRARKLAVGS